MNGSDVVGSGERKRVLNTVRIGNAVLCAECDVLSDSPHDVCLVCGSHSLFNVARIFGGNLPKKRASLIAHDEVEISSREVVLPPSPSLIDSEEGQPQDHDKLLSFRSAKVKPPRLSVRG
jgi:hypothetical protein